MITHRRTQRKIRILCLSVIRFLTVFFILLSVNSESVYASAIGEQYPSIYNDTTLKRTVLIGIDLTIRECYEAADSIFADLARRYPKSPIGPLFRAAVLETKMLDEEDSRPFSRLETFIIEAINKAEKWKKLAPGDPEPLFFQAGAYGYWAVYESHWGGWFAALKRGLKAANRFKKIVELDPLFIDAYMGLGNYLYWKSAKTGFVNWLPFFSDDRRKGINHLRSAAEKGIFVTQTAQTSLMWILLDYGFPEEAREIAHKLHEEYPETKAFWWGIGLSAFASYRWEECIEAFDSLQIRYETEGPGNYFNLIECAYYKAEAAFATGDYARCREECRRAFSYPAPNVTKKRLDDRLARLKKRHHDLGKYAQGEG